MTDPTGLQQEVDRDIYWNPGTKEAVNAKTGQTVDPNTGKSEKSGNASSAAVPFAPFVNAAVQTAGLLYRYSPAISQMTQGVGLFLLGSGVQGLGDLGGFGLTLGSGGTLTLAGVGLADFANAVGAGLQIAGGNQFANGLGMMSSGDPWRNKTTGANANDAKQISSIAKEFNIDRRAFGDYVEEIKASVSRRENFTYEELKELAEQFAAGQ